MRPASPRTSLPVFGLVALLIASVGAACVPMTHAERVELRALRRSSDVEAKAAAAALAATTVDDALLSIARFQDARRGHEELVTLSRHASSAVRRAATRALALVADPGSIDVLIHLLEDGDEAVVAEAAFGLSQVEYLQTSAMQRTAARARAEAALVDELDDCRRDLRWGDGGRGEVCRVVARSLGAIGGSAAADVLWSALGNGVGDPVLQRAVAVALAVMSKDERGAPLTVAQVASVAPLVIERDNPSQWAGSYLLARATLADEAVDAGRALALLAWERAHSPTSRAWALRALGAVGGDEAAAAVAAVLIDPAASARDRVNALRSARPLALHPQVMDQLAGLAPALQAEALGVLGGSEGAVRDRALTWAVLSLGTPDPVVLSALGPLASSEPAFEPLRDGLIATLSSDSAPARRAAAQALSGVGAAEVTAALLTAMEVEVDRGVRIDLVAALAERAAPEVEGLLLELVRGEDPILGAIAAEGLGPRAGGHVTQRLIASYDAATAAGDAERRLAIVKAALPREDAPPALAKKALNDADALVRLAAWTLVIERFDRVTVEGRPPPSPLSELADPRWGMGDVRGATVVTSRGTIELALHPWLAPSTVANWVTLAESGVFDGLPFHRVVPDFVVQTGDPLGTGWGGPGHTIRCEVSAEPYRRGTLGMALSGRDTGGSQWFITHGPQPHLDGRYTVFGQMTGGDEILDQIQVGDHVLSVTVHRGAQPTPPTEIAAPAE